MRKSRLFLTILGLTSLLIFSSSSITLFNVLEMDPPSVYNNGPGGLEKYAMHLMSNQNEVKIIYRFRDLLKFEANEFSVIIAGPDEQIQEVDELIEWVYRGGIAIVLDEFNHTSPLLLKFGLSRGSMLNLIDLAECKINEIKVKILVNVFIEILGNSSARSLCHYRNSSIAMYVNYGKGVFVFVGDSSLVINEIYYKSPSWYRINTEFIRLLSANRKIIIYEGSRQYHKITSSFLAIVLTNINTGIADLISFILRSSLLNRLICLIVVLFILTLYIAYKFELPKYGVIRRSTEFKYTDYHDLKEKVSKGMYTWIKNIEEASKQR